MEDFLTPEFTIGETNFKITKFKALQGWKVLESIRAEIGRAMGSNTLQGGSLTPPEGAQADGEDAAAAKAAVQGQQIASLVRVVCGLSESFVEGLRTKMFGVVFFKNRVAKDWIQLGPSTETAFMDLEPVDVYLVLGRALAVNFFGSLQGPLGQILSDHQNSNQ